MTVAYFFAWGFWLGVPATVLGLAFTLIVSSHPLLVFLLPLVVTLTVVAWRAASISLTLGSDVVVVRDFARQREIEVRRIDGIVPARTGFPAGGRCAGLLLQNGTVAVAVTQSWRWRWRPASRQGVRIVERLRHWASSVDVHFAVEPSDLA